MIPAKKALDAARLLPLSEEGMSEFLGASAERILTRVS